MSKNTSITRQVMFNLTKIPLPVIRFLPPRDSRKIDSRVPPAPEYLQGREATAWRFGYEDFLYGRERSQNRYAEWRYNNRKVYSDAVANLHQWWEYGWSKARTDCDIPEVIPPSER